MWCTELIQWILFVACVVGLVIVWRNWLRAERDCSQGHQVREDLRQECEKRCRDLIKRGQEYDDLADDLEWLWGKLPEEWWGRFHVHSEGLRHALKVKMFVMDRRSKRNLARGLAQASLEAQQRAQYDLMRTSPFPFP